MDQYKQDLLIEIAKLAQRKSGHMNEILRLTKEIADALHRDDKISVQMLLGMRGDELEDIGSCDKNVSLLLEGAPQPMQDELSAVMKGQDLNFPEDEVLLGKVKAIVQAMRNVWKKTMEIDRHMSCRLAGEDSFYKNQ